MGRHRSEDAGPAQSAARGRGAVGRLAAAGLVTPAQRAAVEDVAARYAVAISPPMLDLIDAADPEDPIARQFVPRPEELRTSPAERADPIGDGAHSPVAGIVHRYPDRVLLMPLHVCPVYCRFCFRRESVGGQTGSLGARALARALAYIRGRPEVWEVILSGGDPLTLSPRRLGAILAALERIEHVRVVRIHTRVPAVDPIRVGSRLLDALARTRKALYVVLHTNHVRELTPTARAACGRIVDRGIPMLAQTVLLRGVNDSPQALADLLRALVETRVKPYYLHHPDLAPGTGHFRLPISRGQAIVRELRGAISGLCQPSYVLDIPGGHGKAPIGPAYLERDGARDRAEVYRVEDFRGVGHRYVSDGDGNGGVDGDGDGDGSA